MQFLFYSKGVVDAIFVIFRFWKERQQLLVSLGNGSKQGCTRSQILLLLISGYSDSLEHTIPSRKQIAGLQVEHVLVTICSTL